MAKRFTDSEKWKKPFLRAMKAPYKLLWLYILDECDHAGIWQVDLDVAQIKIGERLSLETAKKYFSGKIVEFDGGQKWLISDFIDFQYGILNPENRAHFSVISILSKYNLLENDFSIKGLIRTLTSPLQGAMDMDKDKEMDKDKDMDKDKVAEKFKIEVDLHSEFSEEIREVFKEYWLEMNYSKTKFRFQDEKFFDFKKRLNTFLLNTKNKNYAATGNKAANPHKLAPRDSAGRL